jgi:D-alanyl-D-alanine carboxypeptidase
LVAELNFRRDTVACGHGEEREMRTARNVAAALLGISLMIAPLATGLAETVGEALLRAYPEHLLVLEGAGADAMLVWKDGTRMPLGSGSLGTGVEKPLEAWLANPDLSDILRFPYHAGEAAVPPLQGHDSGRARPATFFQKMYGDCSKAEVATQLVDVVWLPTKSGQKLKATRINGVAARLQTISDALDKLPARFDVYLAPAAGTYACRPIAGTSNPSAHGFGIAIDVAIKHAHYWRWSRGGAAAYHNEIPMEIVRVFEAHGFIWGGKWWHFDTMHFEYRPELLPPTVAMP